MTSFRAFLALAPIDFQRARELETRILKIVQCVSALNH